MTSNNDGLLPTAAMFVRHFNCLSTEQLRVALVAAYLALMTGVAVERCVALGWLETYQQRSLTWFLAAVALYSLLVCALTYWALASGGKGSVNYYVLVNI